MKPNAIRENPIFPLVLALHSANPRYNNTMNYHYNTLCALHRYIIIASACIQAVYDVPHFKQNTASNHVLRWANVRT